MLRSLTYTDVNRRDAVHESCEGFAMDEESFRGFYDRNARGVWAYLARLTGDRHMADDLLQEAFYRFLRAAAIHENEQHRRNSLFRIATNLARDARRKHMVRPIIDLPREQMEKFARTENEAADSATDCRGALSRLKTRERAMLWLAYAEGASHEEIASVLGLKASSMKGLLFRARRKFAGLLEPQGKKNTARAKL